MKKKLKHGDVHVLNKREVMFQVSGDSSDCSLIKSFDKPFERKFF